MDNIILNILFIGGGNILKRIVSIFLVIFIFTFTSPLITYGELDVDSKAAILMDYNTGDIIFKINEDVELSPASITKVMTLLLTMEAIENNHLSLDDEVVISEYASSMGGTQVYLEPGETQTIESLVKAVCIRSANDAAVALGEAVGGSNDAFISMMNNRAAELNMNNTNFVNASGLPAENHYTTARDVSLMSRELLNHEKIIEYLTIYMEDIQVGKDKDGVQTMVNTNRLVRNYPGTTGVKTGSTNEAGYCLSASAKKDDMHLIAVVLGAESSLNRFDDATRLLDYGFDNYSSILIDRKNNVAGALGIEKGNKDYIDLVFERDIYALIPKNQDYEVRKELVIPDTHLAPIKSGTILGKMKIYINEDEYDSVNLVSKDDVDKSSYLNMLKKTIRTFISNN